MPKTHEMKESNFLKKEDIGRGFLATNVIAFGAVAVMVGAVVATALVVGSWGYFIYTGQVTTIWPLFAVGNQLLASVALAVCTSILINLGRSKYIWVTLVPLVFQKFAWPRPKTWPSSCATTPVPSL